MNINEVISMYKPADRKILNAVRKLLLKRVNKMLGKSEIKVPLIDFSDCQNENNAVPNIALFSERNADNKVFLKSVYELVLNFTFPENDDCDYICYLYSKYIKQAIDEDDTLGGKVIKASLKETSTRWPEKKKKGNVCYFRAELHLRVREHEIEKKERRCKGFVYNE
jgi:hypothetical protein